MTLAKESGCDLSSLTWTATLLQLPVAAAGPFLVLLTLDGFSGLKGMWRILLASSAAFLVPWLLSARYLGGELPDILGGIGTMAALAVVSGRNGGINVRECVRSWMPFILVVALLTVNAFLPPSIKRYITPGALILAAGFIGARMQGLKTLHTLKLLCSTARRYFPAFVTICAVLALARVMGEAGMVALVAKALVAAAGAYYPLVSAALGGLGGFVTGSGTSSCVLFGRLQADVAASIAVSPEILAAANVMGAGIGKMICPQSIAIGAAAAGIAGSESVILRKALPWFAAVILLASAITAAAAFCS
jgi:lactate permease